MKAKPAFACDKLDLLGPRVTSKSVTALLRRNRYLGRPYFGCLRKRRGNTFAPGKKGSTWMDNSGNGWPSQPGAPFLLKFDPVERVSAAGNIKEWILTYMVTLVTGAATLIGRTKSLRIYK